MTWFVQDASEEGVQTTEDVFGDLTWALARALHKWARLSAQPDAGEPDLSHPVLRSSLRMALAELVWRDFIAEAVLIVVTLLILGMGCLSQPMRPVR